MNRSERVEAALKGKKVDRVPVSAWSHFYDKENTLDSFVNTMLSFQEAYDWDYMKIHSRATYHVENWGYTYTQSGKPGDLPVCTGYPIHQLHDWNKIKALPPDQGALGEHLQAVERIRRGLRGQVPFMMTVFAPIMIAYYLVNFNTKILMAHIRENPKIVGNALAAIAETFAKFVRKLESIGVGGIYFATKQANDETMTATEYRTIARPYDLQVLESAKNLPFNMLHICENRIHFQALVDYPVQVVHWDTTLAGNPNFAEGKKVVSAAVGGGVSRDTMAKGSVEDVKIQAREALAQTGGQHFLLGPSCSVAIAVTPEENLRALRNAPLEGMG